MAAPQGLATPQGEPNLHSKGWDIELDPHRRFAELSAIMQRLQRCDLPVRGAEQTSEMRLPTTSLALYKDFSFAIMTPLPRNPHPSPAHRLQILQCPISTSQPPSNVQILEEYGASTRVGLSAGVTLGVLCIASAFPQE